MSFCPSDERLVQLLEEQLDRRELVDLEQHLERCDQCQGTLEELTRERYSLVEWQSSWSKGDANRSGRETSKRSGSTLSRGLDHPSTLLSEPGPILPEIPEVEGYEILATIGRGGMGVVYRARQHGLERLVALKMIRGGDHAAPEHFARFRIEARSVARLRHPNVVQIYDVGHAQGLPFVAFELLEGGSLESRVAGTPQPERGCAELLVTLAGAIGAAHRAGVVHRDLKSANVLFTSDGTPKIADFGLAKRLDEEDGQTQTGQVMGSPSFMAPEQARGRGREVGPAADIYSLGAILYEMLTGRPPFKGSSAVETLYQVVNDEPAPPASLRPGLSRDLETISLKCLSKDPQRRYASAEALADDLLRYLSGSPIQARRTSLRERAWKWARRQPALATLGIIGLVAFFGLAGFGLYAAKVESDEQEIAQGLRRTSEEALLDGKVALVGRDWDAGLRKLNTYLPTIAANPRLSDVRDRVNELIIKLESAKAEFLKRTQDRNQLEEFRQLRRQVQILDTQFLGIGESSDARIVRRMARVALESFQHKKDSNVYGGASTIGPENAPLPGSFSTAEKLEVQQGRSELLLIWAEAVSRPVPGEDPKAQADQALAILERADCLGNSKRACHRLKADFLARKGDARGAESERKLADKIPATTAFDHVLEGQELRRRQKYPAAIGEFESALRIDPDQFRAQLLMAVCQIQIEQYNQAKANLTACLQREPHSISLFLLRGFAYGEDGYQRRKAALKASPRLEDLEKEAEAEFESAESDFQAALALHPSPSEHYGLLVNRGALRSRRHRLDDAVSDFSEAVALKPDEVSAYIALGEAYRQQGRTDLAVAQFTRSIELKPEMAALYRSRALARIGRGKPTPEVREEAIHDLSEAIRLDRPGDHDFAADHARRARLYLLGKRAEDALADCDQALKAVPDDPDALLIRVKSLLELKRFDEVVGACDAALTRGKPTTELYELRGLARSSRQEYSGAIQDFTQALALDPSRSTPLVQRGWAYLVSDAPKLALHDFDEAIRIAPDEPEAYSGRGFARVLQGQHRLAVLDAEESLRKGATDARTPYNAARIYAKAAVVAAAEAPKRGRGLLQVADDYQDHAQGLIRQALERLPADQQGDFWTTVIQADPALAALRQRPKFSQLAGQYGRLAK